MGFGEPSTGKHVFVVVFVSCYFKMLVVLVLSEIRKSIACLIVLRTKHVSIGSFFNHFSVTWLVFSTCDLQL